MIGKAAQRTKYDQCLLEFGMVKRGTNEKLEAVGFSLDGGDPYPI